MLPRFFPVFCKIRPIIKLKKLLLNHAPAKTQRMNFELIISFLTMFT